MLSLPSLHRNLYRLFMMAEEDGLRIKVAYKKKVYILTIERTKEKFVRTNGVKKGYKHRPTGINLKTSMCEFCKSVVLGNICVNKNCPSEKAV